MRRRRLIELLVARWWFAATVATAIAVGFVVAITVTTPAEIPTVALRATPVYRVEVGAAVFFGLYVATMALALAGHNRAFTDVGSNGFKAQDLAAAEEQTVYFEELATELMEEVNSLQAWRKEIEHGNQGAT
jgi:hypothetical protein